MGPREGQIFTHNKLSSQRKQELDSALPVVSRTYTNVFCQDGCPVPLYRHLTFMLEIDAIMAFLLILPGVFRQEGRPVPIWMLMELSF